MLNHNRSLNTEAVAAAASDHSVREGTVEVDFGMDCGLDVRMMLHSVACWLGSRQFFDRSAISLAVEKRPTSVVPVQQLLACNKSPLLLVQMLHRY